MVLREERIWKRFFTPRMSEYFEAYNTARGVRFAKTAEIQEFRGGASVESAVLSNGQIVPCEMVVAGIGVQPVTEVLAGSGIAVDNGVTVDEYLETNRPGVLAAGDVANFQDVIFGKRRRVEHWDNAVSQGQHCARALMGEPLPPCAIFLFGRVRPLVRILGRSGGRRRNRPPGRCAGRQLQCMVAERWSSGGCFNYEPAG